MSAPRPTAAAPRSLLAAIVVVALALVGCGGSGKKSGSTTTGSTTTTPAARGTKLKVIKQLPVKPGQPAFASISKTTTVKFARSKDCSLARWDPNSTGTSGYNSTFFRQLDCPASNPDNEVDDAAVYITFASPDEAQRYINSSADPAGDLALINGPTVVLATPPGSLASVDTRAYLMGLQQSCDCGTLGTVPQ